MTSFSGCFSVVGLRIEPDSEIDAIAPSVSTKANSVPILLGLSLLMPQVDQELEVACPAGWRLPLKPMNGKNPRASDKLGQFG
jgi:hypothetical protein